MAKRIIIAGAIVVFIGAFLFWGTGFIYDMAWARSTPERETLVNEIENTQRILDSRAEIDNTLQYQLEELQSQLDYELTELPDNIYIPGLIDEMLSLAEGTGISIVPLRTTDWTKTEGGYQVYQIQVLVEGEVDSITDYITRLEHGGVSSIVTTSLQLNGDSIGDTEQPSEAKGTLIVAVYGR